VRVLVDLNDQRDCRSVAKLKRPGRSYPAGFPIAASLAKPTSLLTMLLSAIVSIYTTWLAIAAHQPAPATSGDTCRAILATARPTSGGLTSDV